MDAEKIQQWQRGIGQTADKQRHKKPFPVFALGKHMEAEEKQDYKTQVRARAIQHIYKAVQRDMPVFRHDTRYDKEQAQRRQRRVVPGQPEITRFNRQHPDDKDQYQ